jgi:hypothetical protein
VYLPVPDITAAVSGGLDRDLLNNLPVVLYIGPDQILPVTSFIGGAVGLLLMFWHKVMGVMRKVRLRLTPPSESKQTQSRV